MFVHGGIQASIEFSSIFQIEINTGGGSDHVQMDFSDGPPVPASGLSLDGATGADALLVRGANQSDTFTLPCGMILPDAGVITYFGFEEITLDTEEGNDTVPVMSTDRAT